MATLLQDLRYAWRTLRKGWLVTLFAVISLALAIGGNTAVFSLVSAFIFRPQPYDAADRVVVFTERQKDQPPNNGAFGMSLPMFEDLAERSRTIRTWAAMEARTFSLREGERARPVTGNAVGVDLFRLLGVTAVRGRTFLPEEGVEGGRRVALIGYDYWTIHYGDGREALGDILLIDGEPHEVVGVLPRGFSFLTTNQDLWVPIARSAMASPREQRNFIAIGRMAEGMTMDQVRTEMVALATQIGTELPLAQADYTVDSYNMRYDIPTSQTRTLFAMLQGSVLLVLLIACVNITNLLLARGQDRAREIALRTIIGAGRWRIIRQLLTESALMVTIAMMAGIGLGMVGIRLIANQLGSALPAQFMPSLDQRTLIFTLVVSAAAGLIFGLVPAFQTLRRGQSGALREGGRSGTGRNRRLISRALVIAEIALSFVALGGGALLVRSFLGLRGTAGGFDDVAIMTALITVPEPRYADAERGALLVDRIVDAANSVPGASAAALVSALPRTFGTPTDSFRVIGATADAGSKAPRAGVLRVSADYLETLGETVLQGRFFEPTDRIGTGPVVVVDRSFAEERFPGRPATGESIEIGGATREIIGVIGDIQKPLFATASTPAGTVYYPAAQEPSLTRWLMVSTRGDAASLREPLRTALQEVDPDLAVSQLLTMQEYIAQFFVGIRVFNGVLSGFGIMALLLASLGTYGVLAYSVNQRRRELGIRMAVGAKPAELVRMIARQGVTLAVIGLVIGTLLTLPLIQVMNSLMQGLTTVEPDTLVLIGTVLFAVTVLASWVPARLAATVDPVRILNDE